MVKKTAGENTHTLSSHPHNKFIVAMAFDDKYLFPALVAIYSAYSRRSSEFKLLVAFDPSQLSSESRSKVSKVCELIGVELGFIELHLPKFLAIHGHFSALTWARLFIPEEINRPFVYLDADTVCNSGWDELFNHLSLGTTGISAVLQPVEWLSSGNAAIAATQGKYISAGVMVVRPALLPTTFLEDSLEACKNYVQHRFEYVDQCVINFVMGGRVDVLDGRFNILVPLAVRSKTEGTILHFAGSVKPWTAINRFRFFYSYSVKKWAHGARGMLRALKTLGLDVSPLRESFRLLAVDDGLDILNYRGLKRVMLPVIRRVFSRL